MFPGECSAAEDGFQVDPLALDVVEALQKGVKVSQLVLPEGGLVSKALEIGRVFEALQQTLVVPNLTES